MPRSSPNLQVKLPLLMNGMSYTVVNGLVTKYNFADDIVAVKQCACASNMWFLCEDLCELSGSER